jgi:hypothetical protein
MGKQGKQANVKKARTSGGSSKHFMRHVAWKGAWKNGRAKILAVKQVSSSKSVSFPVVFQLLANENPGEQMKLVAEHDSFQLCLDQVDSRYRWCGLQREEPQ